MRAGLADSSARRQALQASAWLSIQRKELKSQRKEPKSRREAEGGEEEEEEAAVSLLIIIFMEEERSKYYKDIIPSYYRRDITHDYTSRCIYMITLFKASGIPPFSRITGGKGDYTDNLRVRIILDAPGAIINNEISHLPGYFPWIEIIRFTIMPDHLHIIIFVKEAGHCHLGNIEATLCGNISRAWHKYLGKGTDTPMTSVFEHYYHDRILRRKGQLRTMKNYVTNNALRNFKRRLVPAPFKLKGEVLINGVAYTFYGNPDLLASPDILAVRIRRSWKAEQIKAQSRLWLAGAARGAVLASPFIRKNERNIRDAAISAGGGIIKLWDNAITEHFSLKPPYDDLFMKGRCLLIGDGEYRTRNFRDKEEKEAYFHSLNDLAAALEEGADIQIKKIHT